MASRIASRRFLSTTARAFQDHSKQELKKDSKRNPETLVRHNHHMPSPVGERHHDRRNGS